MKFKLFLFSLFFFSLFYPCNNYALELEVTSKSAEGFFQGEYNDNFDFFAGGSAIGELELNEFLLIRSGIYLGGIAGDADLKTFVFAKVSPFPAVPADFSLGWNYNGMFAYELHTNSVFLTAAYNYKIIVLSLGYNFRFTSLLGEAVIFEASPLYALCLRIVNNEKCSIGFIWSNYNDFKNRFLTDYTYNFYGDIRINENWQLLNNIEILQNGGIALTETFYGISFKTGARYTW